MLILRASAAALAVRRGRIVSRGHLDNVFDFDPQSMFGDRSGNRVGELRHRDGHSQQVECQHGRSNGCNLDNLLIFLYVVPPSHAMTLPTGWRLLASPNGTWQCHAAQQRRDQPQARISQQRATGAITERLANIARYNGGGEKAEARTNTLFSRVAEGSRTPDLRNHNRVRETGPSAGCLTDRQLRAVL